MNYTQFNKQFQNQYNLHILTKKLKINIFNKYNNWFVYQIFNCEEESKFIDYEISELEKFYESNTDENLKKYAEELIWGDIQDEENFIDKLYEDTIFTIQENLRIYSKYTKYALSDNKLIIIGDVLYNGQSLKQFYNLIQLKCKEIQGIIFKDNGKIPSKVFSNLMKQIFLIPKLKQISFLSSVLHEDSLIELQYLIIKKNVQYLILYRSYFLGEEIDELLDMKDSKTKLKINHQRFVMIDISQKKAYEFTPYSFNFDELKKKENEDMLEVERLYMQQQDYPTQIYNQIIFFQGKNLSIFNKNASDKILFKYWDFLNLTKEKQRLEFQEKQDSLIKILEQQFREDDINILNYSLIKTLIKNVIDIDIQQYFKEILETSKSYQFLMERFPKQVAQLIYFEKESYIQTCYSYQYGFTTEEDIGIYYIFHNQNLYEDIRENKKKSHLQFQELEISLIISEMFTAEQNDDSSIKPVMQNLKQFVKFKQIVNLQLQGNRDPNKTFLFLNEIFKACTHLKKLSLSSNNLNDIKLRGVDFSLISGELEEFDINHNTNIQDMRFLTQLFKKATQLKKLAIQNVQLTDKKIKTIDFNSLSHTLEELNISFNLITSIAFLNTVFKKIPKLKKIDMSVCSLNTQLIKPLLFATGLKEIIINDNTNLNLADLIIKIGLTKELKLEKFSAYEIEQKESIMESEYNKYQSKLEAFSKLKRLHFYNNKFLDERHINLILSNIEFELTDFILKDSGLNDQHFEKFILENIQNLEILDLSENYNFKNFNFLEKIFEIANQLKILNLSYNNITEVKLNRVVMQKIPQKLEEFYFSHCRYQSIHELLNEILPRCQSLKVLHLESCSLNDGKLYNTNWEKISSKLIDLNIANNPKIKTYYFLNNIFKKATGLQIINLKHNKLGSSIEQINFDLLSNKIQQFITGDDELYNQKLQDYLINKFERYINLYTFQQKYSKIQNNYNFNYFGVFEQQNLSSFRFVKNTIEEVQQEEKNKDKDDENKQNKENEIQNQSVVEIDDKDIDKDEDKDEKQSTNDDASQDENKSINKNEDENENEISFDSKDGLPENYSREILEQENELEESDYNDEYDYEYQYENDDKDEALDQEEKKEMEEKRKERNNQNEEQKKRQERQDNEIVLNSKDVKYTQYINPLYFYSFFSQLHQLVQKSDQDQNQSQEERKKKIEFIEQIIEYQNVYSKRDNIYIATLENLILPKFTLPNISFLSAFFGNGQQIKILEMSNMNLDFEEQDKINIVLPLISLVDLNFSGSRCSKTNIFSFVDKIIQKAPNLEKLNLSNMNIKEKQCCNFDLVSGSLQELNISENKHFPNLRVLNGFFIHCQKLRILNIRKIGLNKSKLKSTNIQQDFPKSLEEFNCSENTLNTVNFINIIFKLCENIVKLNLSNCNIDSKQNEELKYDLLAPTLEEIDLSKNKIGFTQYFMSNLLKKCNSLKKIDISGQVLFSHYDKKDDCFSNHSLQDLNFSGNIKYDDYEFVPQLISKSDNFCRLSIQQINLSQRRFAYFRFKDIRKQIRELDISKNDNIEDMTPINYLMDSPGFSVFIAKQTSLNNTLIDQIFIPDVFKNLKVLDLSGCHNFITFDFFNNIFKSAIKLEQLNLSGMQINQTHSN